MPHKKGLVTEQTKRIKLLGTLFTCYVAKIHEYWVKKNNSKYNLHVLCSEQTLRHLLKQLGKVLTHNTNQLNPALNPSCNTNQFNPALNPSCNSPSSISKLIRAESCPKRNLNSLKALEHTHLPSHPCRLPPHLLVELLLPYPCTNTRTHLCTNLCSISKAKLTKVFMCNRR